MNVQQHQGVEEQRQADVEDALEEVGDDLMAQWQRPAQTGQRQGCPKQLPAERGEPRQARQQRCRSQDRSQGNPPGGWRHPFGEAGHAVGYERAGDAEQLRGQIGLPGDMVRPVRVDVAGKPESPQDGSKGGQVSRSFGAQRQVFVGQIGAKNGQAEARRDDAKQQAAVAHGRRRPGPGGFPGEARRQPEHDERQQHGEDVPAEQQRQARLDQQLPESPLLHEHHHAVKGQQHGEQIGRGLGHDEIAVVQAVEGGKRQTRRCQRHPRQRDQTTQRQVGHHGGGGEERQHQQPGCVELRRQVVLEGQDGQLDQQIAANRKAVVEPVVRRVAALVQSPVEESEEVVLGRHVRG